MMAENQQKLRCPRLSGEDGTDRCTKWSSRSHDLDFRTCVCTGREGKHTKMEVTEVQILRKAVKVLYCFILIFIKDTEGT